MNIDPMRVLKLTHRTIVPPTRMASMNIDPMRVLKQRTPNTHPLNRTGFNEHRPDEGTETSPITNTFCAFSCFNEHRPDEGTETSARQRPGGAGWASMNIDPMRVLKLRAQRASDLLDEASMNIDPMRVLKPTRQSRGTGHGLLQ